MSVLDFITFPPLLFEDSDLITPRMTENFALNGHTVNSGSSHLDFSVVIIRQKNLIESDLFTFLSFQAIHDDPLVLLNLVLMASDLDDCVHERSSIVK